MTRVCPSPCVVRHTSTHAPAGASSTGTSGKGGAAPSAAALAPTSSAITTGGGGSFPPAVGGVVERRRWRGASRRRPLTGAERFKRGRWAAAATARRAISRGWPPLRSIAGRMFYLSVCVCVAWVGRMGRFFCVRKGCLGGLSCGVVESTYVSCVRRFCVVWESKASNPIQSKSIQIGRSSVVFLFLFVVKIVHELPALCIEILSSLCLALSSSAPCVRSPDPSCWDCMYVHHTVCGDKNTRTPHLLAVESHTAIYRFLSCLHAISLRAPIAKLFGFGGTARSQSFVLSSRVVILTTHTPHTRPTHDHLFVVHIG